MIPYPFTKGVIIYGPDVVVPRDADADTMEAKRVELETVMRDITSRADAWWDKD